VDVSHDGYGYVSRVNVLRYRPTRARWYR